ncbi:MAG: hypothetical protein Q8936_19540, partial [Bacillota bacterium]|nr:hypothetical protein [Bacillota bacterium]
LACKVLYERPKIGFYMSMNNSQFRVLQEKLREIFNFEKRFKDEISFVHEDRKYIKLVFSNGEISEIYNYNTLKNGDELHSKEIDMVLYSDCLPQFDIRAKKHISMVSIPYTWLAKLYPCRPVKVYNVNLKQLIENHMTSEEWLSQHKKDDDKNFRKEFDLFDEYDELIIDNKICEDNKELDFSNFYDMQIQELMEEYTETPKNRNTTLTRENILKQIKILQDMKMIN